MSGLRQGRYFKYSRRRKHLGVRTHLRRARILVFHLRYDLGCALVKPGGSGSSYFRVHSKDQKPGEGRKFTPSPEALFINGGEIDVVDSRTIVAWCPSEAYYTTDAGKSWDPVPLKKINSHLKDPDRLVALSANSGPNFWALVELTSTKRWSFELRHLVHEMGEWQQETVKPESPSGTSLHDANGLHFFDKDKGVMLAEYLQGDDTKRGLFKTTDGGKTWALGFEVPYGYGPAYLRVVDSHHGWVVWESESKMSRAVPTKVRPFDPSK